MSRGRKDVEAVMEGLEREKVQSVRDYRLTIIEKLRDGYIFLPAKSQRERQEEKAPNIDFGSKEQRESITRNPAYLRVAFRLSQIREWVGLEANDETRDVQILQALDILAKEGRARFISIVQKHDVKFELEAHFEVNSGEGWSNFACTGRKSEVLRFYVDKPLTKAERVAYEDILDVSKHIELLKADTERRRRLRFGFPIDPSIERRLDREKLDAETELGRATIQLAKSMKDKDKRI